MTGPTGPTGPPGSLNFISARVDPTGNFISRFPTGSIGIGITVNRPSTGIYDFTIPMQPNAFYPIVTGIKLSNNADDFLISYDNVTDTGFTICIREQDNGSSPGGLRNNEFSIFIPIFP